jgi:hypothetical protein
VKGLFLVWAGLWRKPLRTVFSIASLAVGFLFTEGIIRTAADVRGVGPCGPPAARMLPDPAIEKFPAPTRIVSIVRFPEPATEAFSRSASTRSIRMSPEPPIDAADMRGADTWTVTGPADRFHPIPLLLRVRIFSVPFSTSISSRSSASSLPSARTEGSPLTVTITFCDPASETAPKSPTA